MDFDPEILAGWVFSAYPNFVNIGADSKWAHLPEPRGSPERRKPRALRYACCKRSVP